MKASLPSIALLNAGYGRLPQPADRMGWRIGAASWQEVQLTGDEQAARDQISKAFHKAGMAVPSAKDVLASLRLDRARARRSCTCCCGRRCW